VTDDPARLAERVTNGDRRALARAITLVESTRDDHRASAGALLDALLPATGRAVRIGISGPPGVGKSRFIEAIGLVIVELGHRVAVLAVDPSSARSGGSILGDKTRMDQLARHPDAFIRPSPSGGTLGGVARRTREARLISEAAGYDVVLVETVGVGQSEVEVDHMVDVFVLLVAAGGGDDLQGIKRGVMELADVVVVTKADGDLLGPARQAASDHRLALHLLRPKHVGLEPDVVLCSAVTGEGISEVWAAATRVRDVLSADGRLAERRAEQDVAWMWSEVQDELVRRVRERPDADSRLAELEQAVRTGQRSPLSAAAELLDEPT
jgi:LAO/AO transport system kinase